MNDDLKFWVCVLLIIGLVIVGVVCLVAWNNDLECSKFITENPDKNFRTIGIEKSCEVSYKGLWVSVDEFEYGIPKW